MQFLLPVYYMLRSLLLRGPLANIKMWRAERRGDREKNVHTGGFIKSHSSIYYHYQGASYFVLERIFEMLEPLTDTRRFTDIGCGMGRVLFVAADKGFLPATGIELNESLFDRAKENLKRFKANKPNCSIDLVLANVLEHRFESEKAIYFLFNPFDDNVLKGLLHKIMSENHAECWFVYMNPVHAHVFEEAGIPAVKKMKTAFYTEAIFYRLPSR